MKFSQMPYKRPIYEELDAKLQDLLTRFKNASSAEECFAVYKEYDDCRIEFDTTSNLAYIRNTLDTTDEFYDAEIKFWDMTEPKLEEVIQEFAAALLASPFRAEMEAKWGSLMFLNAEIELKTFKPEIVSDLQEENALCTKYDKLIASAQIDFDGKTLTLAEIKPYYEKPDRSVRKAAVEAAAKWYMGNAGQLDEIFDKLVKLRTGMAKKLGYENFIELGYYRNCRNCYDKDMVAKFREGVAKHIVPIVTALKKEQARRIGVDTIKYYDQDFEYPDGNAAPKGTADDIFAHAKKMYHELSGETAEFIDSMLENELFDVLTRPGKSAGGYCHVLPKYKAPFIFANFNGTSGDIDVFTHEVGHAFAVHLARDIYPTALQDYPPETAEIHAMAMEFFTWPWMEGFFEEQTDKYYNTHLSSTLTFLPYGVMVDEFQHRIYQNPDMTPAQRNEYWLELEAKYRPWLDQEDVPFYGEGRRWQAQLHIYSAPFYYIDYCLAQIIALGFWMQNQEAPKPAWEKYRRLVGLAGTKTFVELIEDADMPTPFVSDNIKAVADAATAWLNNR
ncbi:MAG: M3 family oligoendopeptidase [Clostridiales bacterium]|jgi:M3 family oligoendopeptidase|nr:M3 family oligoendopeptidase [Clostridiales bacterium]